MRLVRDVKHDLSIRHILYCPERVTIPSYNYLLILAKCYPNKYEICFYDHDDHRHDCTGAIQ